MAKQQITVPDIGGAEGAEVIEMLVAVGDEIEVDQGLLVLESDKASMEIPSTLAGKVVELLAAVGDELAEGAPIAVIETTADASGEQAEAGSAQDSAGGSGEQAEEGKPSQAKPGKEAGDDGEPQARKSGRADAASAEPEPEADSGDGKQDDDTAELTVEIPDIGTEDAVDLIELSVKVGDQVAEGDSLVVLESDKASMEVPSPHAGEVLRWLVKEGASVRRGDPLLVLRTSTATSATTAKTSTAPESKPKPESESESGRPPAEAEPAAAANGERAAPAEREPAADGAGDALVYAGPAVRKMARELGVDLGLVAGTGPRERILKEDLQSFVQRALSHRSGTPAAVGGSGIPAVPEVDFSAFGPVESVARSKLDKLTAANMHRSWLNVPHVTQFDEADITELEAFRKDLKAEAEQRGTRLTPVPFLLKACAIALRDNPKFSASLAPDGESLIYKQYTHIGMAVDTAAGLMVPVIRDVDQKTLWQLAEEVLEMAAKARDRKLRPADMQGGCFTISSLGNIGGNGFSPIVNTPEVGILGVSRASVKPVWDGQAFQPRTLLPLALSYDHRVINGGDAGRFCTQLVALLGDIRRLLL
ncbi:dihydrolipoyllysine-residue acetyltransferase [Kineobactrum salinum]|uniref:Acetyltransferase component of pyruvate dehydrogenase complex n=1 Tax=Kineobactrum salinum TaxID=2708301 RepID=A0A6C0U2B4_9GAMM|nr:dihydrolipoyllysine-residue acetyltransferase [Kineobactrum salinum]QIB66302.1 dihydrolipoyllysine-residue acetyltransferase [Kineobactrum salinum]